MKDYHDAILEKIEIAVSLETAYFHLRLCSEDNVPVVIKAEHLHDMRYPRLMPWGRSISVDNIQSFDMGTQKKLEIKMRAEIRSKFGQMVIMKKDSQKQSPVSIH
jgi:hypothetical protein